MNSRTPTYAQTARLRWAMLGLAALVMFVLLTNASQTSGYKPAAAGDEAGQAASPQTSLDSTDYRLAAASDEAGQAVSPQTSLDSTDYRLAAADDEAGRTGIPTQTLAFALPGNEKTTPYRDGVVPILESGKKHFVKAISIPPPDFLPVEKPVGRSRKYTVRDGDTLSGILDDHNVHSALSGLLAIKTKIAPLLNLRPGNSLKLTIEDGRLASLDYGITPTEWLKITWKDGQYQAGKHLLKTEKREAYAFGIMTSSFYQTGTAAGLSNRIINGIANTLGWSIDFGLDIREGDYFSVVYEEEYVDDEKLRDGNILAIEFINAGKTYRAVRYTNSKGQSGYFSPSGKSVRKPFLRNPIEYARISSHFNPRRLHPIHNRIMPHRGIDYAAPHATPVRATGDGKVIFSGRKTGYGNVVIIKHGRVYSTLYAHLSRFAADARAGSRVHQGQVIGYVGATGYATGPHLHYEFRINGVHKNPLTVKLPDARSLPKEEMPHFKRNISPEMEKLDTLNGAYVSLP